jgi:hypothetical protein
LWTWPSSSGATVATTGVDQVDHRLGTDFGDLPHEAEVDLLPVQLQALALGGEQAGVLAGEADGEGAVGVQQPDQLAVHLSHQHHAHHVHRLGRGDPQPAAELAGDPQPVQHRRDLRPAAVDDHRAHTHHAQEDDVGREGGLQLVVDHRVAAVLHHDDLADVLFQPGQRLDQDGRLAHRHLHEEYSAFSRT